MSPETVSVVIPTYNRAAYLRYTIDSVLAQDYPHIECIVIDGGSTDGSVDILKSYEDRIQWVSEPDEGHADAINKGWKRSTGAILAWLNADDAWTPVAVSTGVDAFRQHPEADVIYGEAYATGEDGEVIGLRYADPWDLDYVITHGQFCIPQPAAFVRRSMVERVGWLDGRFLILDHDLWIRIAGHGGQFRYIPQVLAKARVGIGLSSNGVRMAAASVGIFRRYFEQPQVPARLRAQKRHIISNAHLNAMYFILATRQGWHYLLWLALRAVLADPTNILQIVTRLHEIAHQVPSETWYLRLLDITLALPHRAARRLRQKSGPSLPDKAGLNELQTNWLQLHLEGESGHALMLGDNAPLVMPLVQHGDAVTVVRGVDGGPLNHAFELLSVRYLPVDVLKFPLPDAAFDMVVCPMSLAYIGLQGRYIRATKSIPDGDMQAVSRLREVMKPGARFLLTVPVGEAVAYPPHYRVYDAERLGQLAQGLDMVEQTFWKRGADGRWSLCDESAAFQTETANGDFTLACLVLRKSGTQAE